MKTTTSLRRLALSRRHFLATSAAAGAGFALAPKTVLSQDSRILRTRMFSDINRLDPAVYENSYNVDVINCLYHKLIDYVPNQESWEWELQAAEEIEQVDDTHIRFRLRQGIMWSNDYGELTAEDVKYSFERVIDPDMDSPVAGDFGPLERVDVEDDYTGVIVLSEPFEPLWLVALCYGVGHIVCKKAVEEATGGDRFDMDPPPAFSGPYKLKDWRADEVTVLERNEAWTGDEPAFDEIRLYPIGDEQTAEVSYEAGDLDMTQPSVSSLPDYLSDPPEDTEVENYPSLFYVWLGINLYHEKFQDENVRKAVQWAINVPQILEAAYFGVADPATGIIAPGLVGHRPEPLVPLEGDPERARAFLEEAGKAGMSVRVDVRNTSTFSTAAQVIQSQLNQAGFDASVQLHDPGVWWSLGSEAEGDQWQDLELMLNRFSSLPDPYYATQWFVPDQIGVWNWERFDSSRFAELHEKAVQESDQEERDRMYREMQDIMEESGAYRFITHETNPVMYRQTIEPALRPDGIPLYHRFGRS